MTGKPLHSGHDRHVERLAGDPRQPVVLCAVRYYLPGFRSGGPVRSLSRVVEELGDEFDIRVICLDRDIAASDPYSGIEPLTWTRVGKARVMYVPPAQRRSALWRRVFAEAQPGLLYVNSLFDPWFSVQPVWLARRLGVPTVVAPRGELSPAALDHKRVRKGLARVFFRLVSLHREVRWQACSAEEASDIRKALRVSPAQIVTVPNLTRPAATGSLGQRSKEIGQLRVLFLSRLVPKKNLLGAIRIVALAGDGISLDIWGPPEDREYVRVCREAAEASSAGTRISWRGPVPYEHVAVLMADYDVLLFPTLGENFGHVIFEAVASGLPVLISDRTPWRSLRESGVGVDVPLDDEEAFASELGRFRDMDAETMAECRRRCIEFAKAWLSAHPGAEAYRRLWNLSRA